MSEDIELTLGFELTIESGYVCMDWSKFHEKIEKLVGHPVWTHEFADEDFVLEMKTRLLMKKVEKNADVSTDREESPISSLERVMNREKMEAE